MKHRVVAGMLLTLLLALGPGMAAGAQPASASCWGQASKVFAQMGEMGEHSSSFPTPRAGLRNLARALYEGGVLDDGSMQALGAFVTAELGLSIEACT